MGQAGYKEGPDEPGRECEGEYWYFSGRGAGGDGEVTEG